MEKRALAASRLPIAAASASHEVRSRAAAGLPPSAAHLGARPERSPARRHRCRIRLRATRVASGFREEKRRRAASSPRSQTKSFRREGTFATYLEGPDPAPGGWRGVPRAVQRPPNRFRQVVLRANACARGRVRRRRRGSSASYGSNYKSFPSTASPAAPGPRRPPRPRPAERTRCASRRASARTARRRPRSGTAAGL